MSQKRIFALLPPTLLALAVFGVVLLVSPTATGQMIIDPARTDAHQPLFGSDDGPDDRLGASPDDRLGVCYAFYEDAEDSGNRPYLDLMYEAGARHDRWDFSWSVIQPDNQSQWEWTGHEEILQIENDKGLDVAGILLWTPQWASTYSGLAEQARVPPSPATADSRFLAHTQGPLAPTGPAPYNSYPPKNLNEPVFLDGEINPDNYWGYFAYNIAQHFDGSDPTLHVDAWEIWNEPEWDYFWTGPPAQKVANYCQLLKVAYKAIKGEAGATGGNPDATVLFSGLHYWENRDFYKEVLDCLAAAPEAAQYNHYFDVMSVHFYSRSDNTYTEINKIKNELAARHVGDHPVWLTETGAPMHGDTGGLQKGDYYLSIDEEAAYLLQSYANALAAGVERYYFFRAHDADMGEPFGLIRNDQSLRPAYTAYQVAAEYLRGENQATRVSDTDATRVSLWGTPLGKISVLWNRTPRPVTYTLEAAMSTATLVNRWGVTQAMSAENDQYTFPLPVATANLVSDPEDYIVGGDPLILVETDIASPASRLNPLPERTHSHLVELSWTAGDAGSGVWYTELQVSTSPDGPWTPFAGWGETGGVTEAIYEAQRNGDYYFRARARDRVGNWEPWPEKYEVATTVDTDIFTELRWRVDRFYSDSNRNGVWDRVGTGSVKPEITLTEVSMRFTDEEWHTLGSAIGDSWRFTQTLAPGSYTFTGEAEDADGGGWIYVETLQVDGTVDPLYAPASTTVGLLPRQDQYMPLLLAEP